MFGDLNEEFPDGVIDDDQLRGSLPPQRSGQDAIPEKRTNEPTRALSFRQPHAEAVLRGIKEVEYRSRTTRIRERIFVYASNARYSPEDEADWLYEYGIDDVASDDLPRGVIVGSVELYDSHEGEWYLRNPERADKLRKPTKKPQPVWFTPF